MVAKKKKKPAARATPVSRSAPPVAKGAARSDAPADSGDIAAQALVDLRAIFNKLDRLDTEKLGGDDFTTWFDQFSAVRAALLDLKTQRFRQLNAEQEAEAQNLSEAIADCKDSLQGIQDAAKVVSAAARIGDIAASLVKILV